VQPGEVRRPIGITGDDLAVYYCRPGRHLAKQRCDRGKAPGEVMPIAAEQDDARAHLVRLHTVSVEIHLVEPAIAGRHCLGGIGPAGRNETELGHSLRI
jgi:hypothetical protein